MSSTKSTTTFLKSVGWSELSLDSSLYWVNTIKKPMKSASPTSSSEATMEVRSNLVPSTSSTSYSCLSSLCSTSADVEIKGGKPLRSTSKLAKSAAVSSMSLTF